MKRLLGFYFFAMLLSFILLPHNTYANNIVELGDLVWLDLNSDGIWEAGEPGINGVSVELYQGGAPLASTTTFDATAFGYGDGYYAFQIPLGTSSLPQTYSISVDVAGSSILTGLVPTFDYDGIATPNIASITVSTSGPYYSMDFGYGPTPVPEPSTMLLLGFGLIGLAGIVRKKIKA